MSKDSTAPNSFSFLTMEDRVENHENVIVGIVACGIESVTPIGDPMIIKEVSCGSILQIL